LRVRLVRCLDTAKHVATLSCFQRFVLTVYVRNLVLITESRDCRCVTS